MTNEALVKLIDEDMEALKDGIAHWESTLEHYKAQGYEISDEGAGLGLLRKSLELLQQARDAIPVWRSVEDRFPEPGQGVLYYFEFVGTWPGKYHGDGESNVFGGPAGFLTDDVTHWMPLPVPPADEVSE